jgi:hypothetical protein
MDASALANAESWLSAIATAKLVAAFLVAVGVAIEFGGDWVARPFEKIVGEAREAQLAEANRKANEAANSAATLGVTVDTLTRFAETKAGEANIAIASLNAATERATQKIDEIQKHQAQRHLTVDQKQKLIAALSPFKGTQLEVISVMSDPESEAYRKDFVDVLNASGWIIPGHVIAAMGTARTGITFEFPVGTEEDSVLMSDGVVRFIHVLEELGLVDPHYVRLSNKTLKVPEAHIYIGSKKPLEAEPNANK